MSAESIAERAKRWLDPERREGMKPPVEIIEDLLAENARLRGDLHRLVVVARHVNRDLKSNRLAEAIDAALAAEEKPQ